MHFYATGTPLATYCKCHEYHQPTEVLNTAHVETPWNPDAPWLSLGRADVPSQSATRRLSPVDKAMEAVYKTL